MSTAAAAPAPRRPRAHPSDVRPLITPEGVDLRLNLASVGQRASALLIDIGILLAAMTAFTIVCFLAGVTIGGFAKALASKVVLVAWLLGFFALRNGYFLIFELSPRAATPGKRIVGLRVASRDGARLTGQAVFARNAMREVELFLPLSFSLAPDRTPFLTLFGMGWALALLLLPLFNRDRLRGGDFIAGTWVVRQPKWALRRDMSAAGEALAPRFAFTTAQLDAYGEKELQVLEEVLRRNDTATVAIVADRIRRKIGWLATPAESDLHFLDAFYAAERRKLEGDLLFGRRRRDKHDRRTPASTDV